MRRGWGAKLRKSNTLQIFVDAADFGWGDTNWRAMVWGKVTIANMIIQYGFNLVLSDTDVIWFKDPNEILAEHPKVPLILNLSSTPSSEHT